METEIDAFPLLTMFSLWFREGLGNNCLVWLGRLDNIGQHMYRQTCIDCSKQPQKSKQCIMCAQYATWEGRNWRPCSVYLGDGGSRGKTDNELMLAMKSNRLTFFPQRIVLLPQYAHNPHEQRLSFVFGAMHACDVWSHPAALASFRMNAMSGRWRMGWHWLMVRPWWRPWPQLE